MTKESPIGEERPLRVGLDQARKLVVVDIGEGGVFALTIPQALHFAKMILHNAEAILTPQILVNEVPHGG